MQNPYVLLVEPFATVRAWEPALSLLLHTMHFTIMTLLFGLRGEHNITVLAMQRPMHPRLV